MSFADIIGSEAVQEVQTIGELRFHALGDSGVGHADDAEKVAEYIATDYHPDAGGLNPAFLFHLGDVIYGPSKAKHYGEQFYRPYRHYPGKIIAIPGNHDGQSKSAADNPSLNAFIDNFCATSAAVPEQAAGSGIFRETMTQPGVYWMLDAPFARIIGLYSNRLENPGFLEGHGGADTSQLQWLRDTLTAIKAMPAKALVMATHHPPFSSAGHSGSTEMLQSIDNICSAVDVLPDLFLSAHAHSYQLYTDAFADGRCHSLWQGLVECLLRGSLLRLGSHLEQAGTRPTIAGWRRWVLCSSPFRPGRSKLNSGRWTNSLRSIPGLWISRPTWLAQANLEPNVQLLAVRAEQRMARRTGCVRGILNSAQPTEPKDRKSAPITDDADASEYPPKWVCY